MQSDNSLSPIPPEHLHPQAPQYPLALPGVSLLNSVVNGYFQYQNLAVRKREFAELNAQRDRQHQESLNQRERHHEEGLNQRDRHHEQGLQHQERQAEQAHNWRIEEPNWPLSISPKQYAHKTTAHDRQPLIVMLSPPPPEADKDFRDAAKVIENELRVLLQKSYDANEPKRPVYFLDKAWKKGMEGGAAPAQALHHALHEADAPTFILDLELTGRELRIQTHYWGIGSNELKHTACETAFPLSEYMAQVARRHAREWGEATQDLGRDATPSKTDKENWLILQSEEALRQKDPQKGASFYVRHYHCPPEYLLQAVKEVTPALQLLVGSMADLYHLFRYGTAPQLPALLGKLLRDGNTAQAQTLMRQTLDDYSQVMDFAAEQRPEWAPPFHLELAEVMAGLNDAEQCQTHLLKSLAAWRRLRGAEPVAHEAQALLTGMEATLQHEDEAYLLCVAKLLNKPLQRLDIANIALGLAGAANTAPKIEAPKVSALSPVDNIHGWPADQVQALQQRTAQALGKPVVFRDTLKSGGEGPDMVVIPAGAFLMGSPEREPGRNSYEGPQHFVTFAKPFAIGRYAVTFDDYDRYCYSTKRSPVSDNNWGRGRRPVINVNWQDAQDYCAWLSAETDQHYRLPSEAEWEYACRAGSTTLFHWGNTINTYQANYNGRDRFMNFLKGSDGLKTAPVEEFQPNAFGLYQMHGNVNEWCEDDWHRDYIGAPEDGVAWGSGGMLRGGAFCWDSNYIRSASRIYLGSGYRFVLFGFRLAQD
jgi:formylglycine-generating enzyme required for sulfatase activity